MVALKLCALGILVAGLVAALGGGTAPAGAQVPGANGHIAFTSNRDGNLEIYLMNADGTNQHNITNQAQAHEQVPIWSPDGSEIAFATTRDDPHPLTCILAGVESCNNEIYVMNADGSGQTRLTNNVASDMPVGWSPDGTKIAFTSNRDGTTEIYEMNADGSGQTRLTNNTAYEKYENAGVDNWSPDGMKILFTTFRDANFEVYEMNPDGTNPMNLTQNPAAHDVQGTWSPNGSRIAFSSSRDASNPLSCVGLVACNTEIYVMNADGSNQTRLTSNTFHDLSPFWSPDGSKIGFESNRTDPTCSYGSLPCNLDIWVMNPDGSGQINLTNNLALDFNGDWQPVRSVPVGGVSFDRQAAGLPLRASESPSTSVWLLAAIAGATAAVGGTVAAASYARIKRARRASRDA